MFTGIIAKAVAKGMKQKVVDAEKRHADEVKNMDEEFKVATAALLASHDAKKGKLVDTIVKELIG